MKKTNINWLKVYYNFKRNGDSNKTTEVYIVNTNQANINKLMLEFKNWCKTWQGKGYIEIISIAAGAYQEAEKWAEKYNSKFAGKKIKFNN